MMETGSACFQFAFTASKKSLSTKLCSSRAQLRMTYVAPAVNGPVMAMHGASTSR